MFSNSWPLCKNYDKDNKFESLVKITVKFDPKVIGQPSVLEHRQNYPNWLQCTAVLQAALGAANGATGDYFNDCSSSIKLVYQI